VQLANYIADSKCEKADLGVFDEYLEQFIGEFIGIWCNQNPFCDKPHGQ
jgi:hypothetical protein